MIVVIYIVPFSLKLISAAESANFSPPTWCFQLEGVSPSVSDLSSHANSDSGNKHEKTDGLPVASPKIEARRHKTSNTTAATLCWAVPFLQAHQANMMMVLNTSSY